MADLIRAGKIRYFGISNYRSWRLAEICRLCDEAGIDRPVASQPYYNAMNRMPEVEHLPACGYFGLGVVPYSPLARGVLTGKYDPDIPPPAGTRGGRQDMRMMQTEWRRESLEIAQEIKRHAEARGITPVQFAFAWVLNNRLVTAPIAGPRTLEQFEGYLPALSYAFAPEDEALVDSLVATGHPSTPGFNDPAYPIEGRPTRSAPAAVCDDGRKRDSPPRRPPCALLCRRGEGGLLSRHAAGDAGARIAAIEAEFARYVAGITAQRRKAATVPPHAHQTL